MDVVVEHWHELSVASAKDLDVLQLMLTVVAFVRAILVRVAPNQDRMAGPANFYSDLLATVALDHELLLVEQGVFKIINKHCPVLFLLSHDTS